MDPQTPNIPSFELPSPTGERGGADTAERQPINAEPSPEQFNDQPAAIVQGSIPMIPSLPSQPTAAASVVSSQPEPTVSATTPSIADDNDLIEKAWVDKAKEIVAKTKNDPYVQNKELSRFKADYIKKRYNKEVKLAED